VVGVGIFFTPNVVAGLVPGPTGALIYMGTAFLLLPIALTVALLGRHLPIDGGPCVWASDAFGSVVGYGVGWVAAVSAVLSTAAVLAGVGTHVAAAFGQTDPGASLGVSCVCLVVLSFIAALGLRPSAWTWNTLTLLKLMPLAVLLVLFAVAPGTPRMDAVAATPVNVRDYGRALLVTLFTLQGFEVVPVLAGSVGRERRAVPFATIGSLVFAAVLYAALQLACVASVPRLAAEGAPLVAAAGALGGGVFARLVAIGTIVSAFGILFGMMVMTPRYLSALGTDDGLGRWLGRVDERGVPRPALVLTVAFVFVLLLSMETVAVLLVLSSASVLVQYVASQAALIRLAVARRHGLRAVAALPALLGLVAVVLFASSLALKELVVLGGALMAGILLWVLRRVRVRRAMTR
jgi:amino acid transporter